MIPPLTLTAEHNIKTNCEAVLPLFSTSASCYACYCSAQLGICEKAWGKYNQHKLIVLPSVYSSLKDLPHPLLLYHLLAGEASSPPKYLNIESLHTCQRYPQISMLELTCWTLSSILKEDGACCTNTLHFSFYHRQSLLFHLHRNNIIVGVSHYMGKEPSCINAFHMWISNINRLYQEVSVFLSIYSYLRI